MLAFRTLFHGCNVVHPETNGLIRVIMVFTSELLSDFFNDLFLDLILPERFFKVINFDINFFEIFALLNVTLLENILSVLHSGNKNEKVDESE